MTNEYGIVAVVVVALATVLIGAYGLRISRSTSDFFVASRSVSPWLNASAVSGEYLSAASFLGVAGLVFAYGPDGLWYPVGYTAGYLVLLTLVAAPLRRSGAYTLPDFAEMRLQSRAVRRLASAIAIGIAWLYLLPQLQGAGLTLRTITGAAPWVGGLLVAVIVIVIVASGGMRSISFVQAFQYWLKLTAILVPAIFIVIAWRAQGGLGPDAATAPTFRAQTTVNVTTTVRITVKQPVAVEATGRVDEVSYDRRVVRLDAAEHVVDQGTVLTFGAGVVVPQISSIPATTNQEWARPLSGTGRHPLYATYSLIVALFLGAMGLPHVIVRFYTNVDGRAARRTTVAVIALLGAFYLIPPIYGALGRLYTPQLLLTGYTDAVVLVLPGQLIPGPIGTLLGALVAGGAFAAFLSTSSGLVLSVAGILSQGFARLRSISGFRVATVLAGLVPSVLAFVAPGLPVADVVGLAFAVAASSFCPLILLGIWWSKLTSAGAITGMAVGGGAALVAGALTIVGWPRSGWLSALLAEPAAWTAPLGFLVMIAVSLRTRRLLSADVGRIMARLHAPEGLRLLPTVVKPTD